jgi:DNA-binding NarL/FixJ family response regulator
MSISLAIVEDLAEVREGLKQFISLNPEFRILGTFQNAEEAMSAVPELNPDIVIMDINLPGMSGIEFIRRIKNKAARTQFMMFTVYENDEKVFEALKAGATGYLLKSTGLLQLIGALKELYNGGSPMSANIARKLVNLFREEHTETAPTIGLSKRENQILQFLSKGLLYKEIADQVGISKYRAPAHP